MTKLVLAELPDPNVDPDGFVTTYNANCDAIELAFANTLSRDGSTPNTLTANVDFAGNHVINGTVISGLQPPGPVLALVRAGLANNLSWNALDGADGYRLYNADTLALIVDTPLLAYVHSGLAEYSTHRYFVRGYTTLDGNGPVSNTVQGDIGGPFPPVLAGSVQTGSESILLNWTVAATGGGPITGYKLYNAATGVLIFDTHDANDRDYLNTGLSINTEYSYYVKSYTAQNTSAPSNTVTLNTESPGIIVDIYNGPATWHKRDGLIRCDVVLIGGGAGGAGGSTGPPGGYHGSTGGAGGGYCKFTILAEFLGSTEDVLVGAGGAGGLGHRTDYHGRGGDPGVAGGTSSFGSWGQAQGGDRGLPDSGTGTVQTVLGGIAFVTLSPGPTSVTTERGGFSSTNTANNNTTRSGAGGGIGAYFGHGPMIPGVCANDGIPYYGGNGGDAGALAPIDADGQDGLMGHAYGGGGGAGSDASASTPLDAPLAHTGNGAAGYQGIVVVTNYLA